MCLFLICCFCFFWVFSIDVHQNSLRFHWLFIDIHRFVSICSDLFRFVSICFDLIRFDFDWFRFVSILFRFVSMRFDLLRLVSICWNYVDVLPFLKASSKNTQGKRPPIILYEWLSEGMNAYVFAHSDWYRISSTSCTVT